MTRREPRPAADGTSPTWHDGGVTAPLTPHEQPPEEPPAQGAHPDPQQEPGEPGLARELRQAAIVTVAVAVSGVLLGLLWLWLAPRLPLISDDRAVYLKNPEGEEAIGMDGTFVLLALGFGVLTSAVVFWLRRRGGIALVVGLVVGGLLGSLLAWRVGVWLGPETDIVAAARSAGKGVVFDAPLKISAKGALLAWPFAAMVVHLVLT
ncbi:ABC transporter permease, partial [Streptomyces sp. NPDC057654]|uniref:ABC transporter permease n=1 Tax=Streptomyces sp. NPDC057654 TaxID=3346196 RepID=UPI0036A8E056